MNLRTFTYATALSLSLASTAFAGPGPGGGHDGGIGSSGHSMDNPGGHDTGDMASQNRGPGNSSPAESGDDHGIHAGEARDHLSTHESNALIQFVDDKNQPTSELSIDVTKVHQKDEMESQPHPETEMHNVNPL